MVSFVVITDSLIFMVDLGVWRSRDGSVGIATGYGLDERGVGLPSPGWVKNFPFTTSCRLALGPTQPPIQGVPGDVYPGVKRQKREADHSTPASAEVKKNGFIHSLSHTPPRRSA
jgi:hypothetical protein